MKNINVRMSIPEDLHRKVKITAATQGLNIGDAVVYLLKKYYEVIEDEKRNRD